MLIHQMSDLHLEFNPDFRAQNTQDADILVLGGDICVADYFNKGEASPYHSKAQNFIKFFEYAAEQYKHVLYILGNHESYHGRLPETAMILIEALSHISNLIVLDFDYVDIEDVRFVGTTLWTDCDGGNPLVYDTLSSSMNDFRLINNSLLGWNRFTPKISRSVHKEGLLLIQDAAKDHDKVVVLTHHAPSYKSIHEKYKTPKDTWINHGYFSDLDQFILDRPQIKLWTHGHVHNSHDYHIGSTRVVCSPHGYGKENIEGFGIGTFIEV